MSGADRETLASLEDVRFSYDGGRTWALDGVDLTVREGDRIALVGPNGSGKSTLSRLIAGLVAPDMGTVVLMGRGVFDDERRADAGAYRAARRSIGAVFQNPEDQIVTTVVAEDVAFGPENLDVSPDLIGVRVRDALDAVGMAGERDADPTALSGGQQQRVAIADMLAMDSRLLVLDEPTAMLDPVARAEVLDVIDAVHRRGTAIVMVTHHPDELAGATRVVTLRDGRIVSDEPGPAAPREPRRACASTPGLPIAPRSCADPAVLFEHVTFRYPHAPAPVIDDLSIAVARGSTVALVGPNGSGKTTFARLLCALIAPERGAIRVDGVDLRRARRTERKALRGRLGLVMQRPERQLFAPTVREDVAFGPRNQGLTQRLVDERVDEALRLAGIEALADRDPFSLSGGQQRLVAIAGVLACRPSVLVMDEPTASLDACARARVDGLIRALQAEGATIVLITHDMDAANRLADTTLVFGGRVEDAAEEDASPSDPHGAAAPATTPADPSFSWVSGLDPRAKTLGFLTLMFCAFALTTPAQLAVGCATVAALAAASRLGLVRLWRSVRMFLAMFACMGVLNLLVVREGRPLASVGAWSLTTGGVWIAVLYTLRFSLVIVLGAVVMLTTTPTALTDAFASVLAPLRRRVHVQEIALVMSLALRFLPTLADETVSIRDAQSARGGSIETGSLVQRIRAMCAIIVPVFAAVIRHADNLALALDARCYQEGMPRSHWHAPRMRARDWTFLAIVAALVAALVGCAVFSM